MKKEEKAKSMENPIDPDKVAENPHLLPYAHTVGGAVIKPIDRGRIKGLSLTSMYDQSEIQLDQIREQINLLASQARAIKARVLVSEQIYQADMSFKPVIGHVYHLYQRSNGSFVLSMVAPGEWGNNAPFDFIASVKLMADHTWEITEGDAEKIIQQNS
ncbi:MAG: DUF2452 domain-containing protein [Bacteroidetes bacterium]|nr:DUF2452 domain-containing protein [Bacteroidota bacterium]